jgi:hypothetical protein
MSEQLGALTVRHTVPSIYQFRDDRSLKVTMCEHCVFFLRARRRDLL